MQSNIIHIFLILFFSVFTTWSQENEYGIKNPEDKFQKRCGSYVNSYNRLPNEIRYSVQVQGRNIIFTFPSREEFDILFDKNTDGIAVDIITKDQYTCDNAAPIHSTWPSRGKLLAPMFKDDMLEVLVENDLGYMIIPYGEVPEGFDPNEIECNLLVLQKKYLCGYHAFSNLPFANWSLLEMGLYRDSLSSEDIESYQQVSKTISFSIPFKKDMKVFDLDDIQPLYDSLELTDYNITMIKIDAYTSIEGSKERNTELQIDRARSIIAALQTYQSPEIETITNTYENWVEFLTDIEGTEFEHLSNLSKSEIKSRLLKPDILEKLEPLLKNHRKALVQLNLQKRFSNKENDPSTLKMLFNQSIASKNIGEAVYLQSIAFEKIRDQQLPDEFINELKVPNESFFGPLLNNLRVFSYQSNNTYLYESIRAFEELSQILPDNPKVLYNLTALRIHAWTKGESMVTRSQIIQSISKLQELGLNENLLTRLRINYYIILTSYYERERNYRSKTRSLREVYTIYDRIHLSDNDLLSLSKYLSFYSKFDWAKNTLNKRVTQVDVSEDLIYYFIRLTISDQAVISKKGYRKFLLNAIEKNRLKFCKLFDPTPQGGYTFQLLENSFLRQTYCENCSD